MEEDNIVTEELTLDIEDDKDISSDVQELQNIYPASINVSQEDNSIFELKRQFDKKRIQLSPSYQRGNVWSQKQKSELIESILMGIPLPIMYFFEDKSGIKQVVDGKQRLSALFDFMENKFSLTDLSIMSELKGKKFNDLNGISQGKIEDYKVSINVIKPPTPDRIKFDIFDRVNRGGTRLNNQEMRNAIYQGEATKILERLKDSEDFKKATDYSIRDKVMKDRYVILRFIAFYLWKKGKLTQANGEIVEYKSDIDNFLGKAMEFLNSTDTKTLKDIEDAFNLAMKNACDIFGQNGFRVSTYFNEEYKRAVNMALFEVLSYLLTHKEVEFNHKKTKDLIFALFNDSDFNDSITTPVDSSTKLNKRFEKIEAVVKELQK